MQPIDINKELFGRGLLPTGPAGVAARRFIRDAKAPDVDRYRGALLGIAIGDALGRPVEHKSPRDIRERHGEIRDFVSSIGSISDDTQLTRFAAHALLEGREKHPIYFADTLASELESIRSPGNATRRSIRRLRNGMSWWRSGEWSAAGNGVAMRAAPFGLAYGNDLEALRAEVARNAVVTHASSMAVASGIVQAYAVARLARTERGTLDPLALLAEIVAVLDGYDHPAAVERRRGAGPDKVRLVDRIAELGDMLQLSPAEAFEYTNNGAFVLESLPAALWSFLSRPEDPEEAIVVAVNGGYDGDTVGSMAGALAGAYHGASALPERWTRHVESAGELADLGTRLHQRLVRGTPSSRQHAKPVSAADADRVHVSVLLDRSGSMQQIADDTIGGFNAFVAEQRALSGECRITLVQFDNQDPHEVVADAVPVAEMSELTRDTYQPRGMTPLLDSLGALVERVDRRIADDAEEFQLVAVITDGQENASHRFSRMHIAEMVKDRSDDGWAFVFLGANLDSFAEAGSMGMDRAQAADWEHSAAGASRAFDALSRSSRKIRDTRGMAGKRALKDSLMDEVRAEWKSEDET